MLRIKLPAVVFTLLLGVSNLMFGQDLEVAKKYIFAEQFDNAKEVLNKIIKAEPNNASAYFYLGKAIIREYLSDSISNSLSDVSEDARKAFETGLSKDSTYQLNNVGLGMLIQLTKSDTTAANRYFNKALASFPKNKKKYTREHALICVYTALGQTLGNVKRDKNATMYINRAKEIAPNDFEVCIVAGNIYLDKKDGTNAIANFNKALIIDPKSPVPQIKIGDLYVAAKNYNSARNYYDQAKELDSTYAPVYKSYGELWSIAGKYALAKENFRKYLDLSGGNISSKVSYAISLFKTGDYAEAVSVIKEIQAVDNSRNFLNRIAGYSSYNKKPADLEGANTFLTEFFKNAKQSNIIQKDYLYYGRTLLRLKKDSLMIDKGFQMLSKASEMAPDDINLTSEIALAYFNFDYYTQAIDAYNKKIQAGKATSADLINLGRAYMQLKDYVKAAETFDKVVAADPKNMEALVRSTQAYANQDPDSKLGLAKPKYEEVIKLGETDPKKYSKELYDAYKYMGSYYLFADNSSVMGQCEDYYKKIIPLDPNNKEWLKTAYSSLAILFTKTKSYEAARSWYRKVLEVDPKNDTAIKAIDALTKQINMQNVMGK